jgi:uncharacterized protein (TIGR03790 family)
MMRILVTIFFMALVSSVQAIGPDTLLVVYNSTWPHDADGDGVQDSKQVVDYYRAKRNIPEANILGLDLDSTTDVTSYTAMRDKVIAPIRAKLSQLGETNIDCIVTVHGIPRRYNSGGAIRAIDNILNCPGLWASSAYQGTPSNPYHETSPSFGSDKGRFVHSSSNRSNGHPIYMVCRIQTPMGPEGAINLIDQAVYGDRYVSVSSGMGYVDSLGLGYNPQTLDDLRSDKRVIGGLFNTRTDADLNIAYTLHHMQVVGMATKWERSDKDIGQSGAVWTDGTPAIKSPDALLYSGWYKLSSYYPSWTWSAGAVACDVNSYSMSWSDYREDRNLRNDFANHRDIHIGWGPMALIHGATAVPGTVSEPSLFGHHRPHVLVWAMLKGWSYGEAAFVSTPRLSWMMCAVGDPLYQPFRVGKPVISDDKSPSLETGFPIYTSDEKHGPTLHLLIDNRGEPEVAKVLIDYGLTDQYGLKIERNQYWRRHTIGFRELQGGATYHYKVTLTDPAGNKKVISNKTFITPEQTPFNSIPHKIPGVIQAEDFDRGGQSIAYHDLNSISAWYRGETGADVLGRSPDGALSNIWNGEWTEYTVQVESSGVYKVLVHCNDDKGKFQIQVDGKNVGELLIPSGSRQWKDLETEVTLTSGRHVIRLSEVSGGRPEVEGWMAMTTSNIDRLEFRKVGGTVTTLQDLRDQGWVFQLTDQNVIRMSRLGVTRPAIYIEDLGFGPELNREAGQAIEQVLNGE